VLEGVVQHDEIECSIQLSHVLPQDSDSAAVADLVLDERIDA
jgi:hypothetical protein